MSTDPDPNPGRVYRAPTWDAGTMMWAELVTGVALGAWFCNPTIPASRWCHSFNAALDGPRGSSARLPPAWLPGQHSATRPFSAGWRQ